MSDRPSTWRPKNVKELEQLPDTTIVILDELLQGNRIMFAPNAIVWKYGTDLTEEAYAQPFARDVLGLPVPRIFHHSRPPHRPRPCSFEYITAKSKPKIWYICMERCSGVSLDKVVDSMTEDETTHVAQQLKAILASMASVKSKFIGNVKGNPLFNCIFEPHLNPTYAFSSCGEFLNHYKELLLIAIGPISTGRIFQHLPRNDQIYFVHGDMVPKNIMVEGSTITGIIDWETAGYYPAFWEYARMHDPEFVQLTPGWGRVLEEVFPGPRREDEIYAVKDMLRAMSINF